jgi:adenosylcobyric acid synthase
MLGNRIADPHGMEAGGKADGLGLLPVATVLTREKQTRAVVARTPKGVEFGGYEIHLGETVPEPSADLGPFATLEDGSPDGARAGRVMGTYLHGALEHPRVCAELFGIDAPVVASKISEYDRLADWFEENARNLNEFLPKSEP